MLFTISGKHVDVPVALKQYAEEKTSKLPRLYNIINQVEVVIEGKEGIDMAVEIIAKYEAEEKAPAAAPEVAAEEKKAA